MLTQFLPLVGVALITLALLMMLRKRKQYTADQPTAREQLERMKQKRAMRGDLEHLMVELEELTRRFNAQLDAKSLQLEKLIDQADRRIDELKRLEGDAPAAHGVDEPRSVPPEPTQRPLPPAPAPSDVTSDRGVAPASEDDQLTERVYALADQGHAPADIARELDEHVGKIELMLALRQN